VICAAPIRHPQANTPLPAQDFAGPPVLPSQFLREALACFLDRLRQHQAAVAELEQVLAPAATSGATPGCPSSELAQMRWDALPGRQSVAACI
jgi:hypothetical protein